MTVCTRCHRPLKWPTATGMGPVCSRASKRVPVPAEERDLFGYDVEKACHAALYRIGVCIESAAAEASMAVRASFASTRRALGVWS